MSQGIIRLKKVKVAPKKSNSIIKTTDLKKQLSVRFEDQKSIQTIKNLSQDIDLISKAIDSYFPLKVHNIPPPKLTPATEGLVKYTKNPNPQIKSSEILMKSNKDNNCTNSNIRTFSLTKKTDFTNGEISHTSSQSFFKSIYPVIPGLNFGTFSTYNNTNAQNQIITNYTYKPNSHLIKKNRIFKPQSVQSLSKPKSFPLISHQEQCISPKVVKQSIPIKLA